MGNLIPVLLKSMPVQNGARMGAYNVKAIVLFVLFLLLL
jgi:hypothetical protein